MGAVTFSGRIEKANDDQRVFWAWLSVVETADGKTVVDLQGHVIEPAVLEAAADRFNEESRVADERHWDLSVGVVLQSVVTTREWQDMLGIPRGTLPVGWLVKVRVDDPVVWAKVKSGEYAMMSIGGEGQLEEITVA